MFVTTIRFVALTSVAMLAVVHAFSCPTPPDGSCGSNAGVSCCQTGYYCQPQSASYYQCQIWPDQCTRQLVDTDFHGNDIKTARNIKPDKCCDECAKTPHCTSYTLSLGNGDGTTCYLKSGAPDDMRTLVGAVSGLVNGAATLEPTPTPLTPASPPMPVRRTPAPTTPTLRPLDPRPNSPRAKGSPPLSPVLPASTKQHTPLVLPAQLPPTSCITVPYGSCGDYRGAKCCSNGQYCQPWNDNYYQCMPPPSQCKHQATDTDYYGNDIKTVYVNHPDKCCTECTNTPGCRAYTFINSNTGPTGQPVCYLKSAVGAPSRLVGAVSGRLN